MPYISYKRYRDTMKLSQSIGRAHCTLKWDYQHQTCELSMPRYVHQAVEKLQHSINHTTKSVDAPHPYKGTKTNGLPIDRIPVKKNLV